MKFLPRNENEKPVWQTLQTCGGEDYQYDQNCGQILIIEESDIFVIENSGIGDPYENTSLSFAVVCGLCGSITYLKDESIPLVVRGKILENYKAGLLDSKQTLVKARVIKKQYNEEIR